MTLVKPNPYIKIDEGIAGFIHVALSKLRKVGIGSDATMCPVWCENWTLIPILRAFCAWCSEHANALKNPYDKTATMSSIRTVVRNSVILASLFGTLWALDAIKTPLFPLTQTEWKPIVW